MHVFRARCEEVAPHQLISKVTLKDFAEGIDIVLCAIFADPKQSFHQTPQAPFFDKHLFGCGVEPLDTGGQGPLHSEDRANDDRA